MRRVSLDAQFRCGGSEAYVSGFSGCWAWHRWRPMAWEADERFALDVVETATELESRLSAYRDSGYGARMTAGFCWPWSDPTSDGRLVPDVEIGSWSRPWNLKGDRGLPGAPPAALWASRPEGFGQVGCVYTAQGFEYDWNGVIIGPDLVWRKDRWVAQRKRKGSGLPVDQVSQRCRVRSPCPPRLQGADDTGNGRDPAVQHG